MGRASVKAAAAVAAVVMAAGLSVPAAAGTANAADGGKRVPKLTMRIAGDFDRVQPGAELPVRLLVRNEGDAAAAEGFGIDLNASPGAITPRHGNCRYGPTGAHMRCHFTRVLRPGETVALRPLGVNAPTQKLYSHIETTVYGLRGPNDPATNPDRQVQGSRQGSGPELVPAGAADDGTGRFRGLSQADVTLDDYVDLQARGGTVRGWVGQTVAIEVAVRGHGPGGSEVGSGAARWTMRFTAPQGTHVVGMPEDDGQPLCDMDEERRHVECPMHSAWFRLRIDRGPPGADGRVEAVTREEYPPHDPNRANDTAPVHLEITSAPGTAAKIKHWLPWVAAGGGVLLVLNGLIPGRRRRDWDFPGAG